METIKSLVETQIDEFLTELNGRYQAVVSDKFLKAYLIRSFEEYYAKARQRSPVINYENVAYGCSVYLFETVIEYGCGTGFNGHHTAQRFAEHFKRFTYQGNFNSEVQTW